MIELSEKQINTISRSIHLLDIKSYIEKHPKEYEQFLEENNQEK